MQDAVHTVLPIIVQLAKDTEDSVKEALAGELDKIMYYYYEVSGGRSCYKQREEAVWGTEHVGNRMRHPCWIQ